jgi:hypothetical protein
MPAGSRSTPGGQGHPPAEVSGPDPARPPSLAAWRFAAGAVAAGALVVYAFVWVHVTAGQQRQTDFSVFYAAALLVRTGQGAQLYNQGLEAARHASFLLPGAHLPLGGLAFIQPPTTALLALPFSLLAPGPAYWTWSLAQLGLLVAALLVAAGPAPWPDRRRLPVAVMLMALAGGGSFLVVYFGQSDGLACLAVAVAYWAWRHQRRLLAGVCLGAGFGAAKPHLAIGLAVFVIGRRDWRALTGMALGAAAVVAVSVATVGVGATLAFVGNVGVAVNGSPLSGDIGIFGAGRGLLGTAGLAVAGPLAALALVACFLLGEAARGRAELLEVGLAGALVLSLVVAPHLHAYDLAILGPAFVWLVARGRATDGARGRVLCEGAVLAGWAVLGVLVALHAFDLWGSRAPLGEVVIPLVLLGLGMGLAATAVRRVRPVAIAA